MIPRPKCRRCGGPLDIWFDPDDMTAVWHCNNPKPMETDEQFEKHWNRLDGDDVVRLERDLEAK
jgi:hypothetical protein